MPFADEYKDAYEYVIKVALESAVYRYYRADKYFMCKICNKIQKCSIIIVNISGLNPNIMLELGLEYGIGNKVIFLKDSKTKNISDLVNIEYNHTGELQEKLYKIL